MFFSVLIGQISTAADNLNVVVYGLLTVAALLALLTIWYWRHTKPVTPILVARAASQETVQAEVAEEASAFDPDSVWADGATETDDGIAFDDWLSITSPEPGPEAR